MKGRPDLSAPGGRCRAAAGLYGRTMSPHIVRPAASGPPSAPPGPARADPARRPCGRTVTGRYTGYARQPHGPGSADAARRAFQGAAPHQAAPTPPHSPPPGRSGGAPGHERRIRSPHTPGAVRGARSHYRSRIRLPGGRRAPAVTRRGGSGHMPPDVRAAPPCATCRRRRADHALHTRRGQPHSGCPGRAPHCGDHIRPRGMRAAPPYAVELYNEGIRSFSPPPPPAGGGARSIRMPRDRI